MSRPAARTSSAPQYARSSCPAIPTALVRRARRRSHAGSTGRFDSRREAPRSRPPALCRPAAGDPAAGLDEHYQQAYDLVLSAEAPGRVRHPPRVGVRPRSLWPQPMGQRLPPRGDSSRWGAVHHCLRRRLGPPRTCSRRCGPGSRMDAGALIDDPPSAWLESTMVIALGEFGRRRRSTRMRAATTGRTRCRCCSRAAAPRAGRSSATDVQVRRQRASAAAGELRPTVYCKPD